MQPDCQLRAFNAEVTGSPIMVLSPYSHSCPPTLVPLFGDDGKGCGGWRTVLSSQGTSSSRTWCSSVISPSSFGPSLVILGCFSPRLGPWAYHLKWAEAPRSFGPTNGYFVSPLFCWYFLNIKYMLICILKIFFYWGFGPP